MDDNSSYNQRKSLQFIKNEPKFLQKLQEQDRVKKGDGRIHQRFIPIDDEPVLVDSEGNALPEEALEQDKKFDSLFSIVDDLDEEEFERLETENEEERRRRRKESTMGRVNNTEQSTDEDNIDQKRTKKAKSTPLSLKSDKSISNKKLLSFESDG